ncbi:histone-lysine N-methyltransferase 2D [Anguilla anguilla]|uniref:histone-lysine N-methyltransferase 2D n=1 Tax=Anguilla anguilla TaxID=7936 RepID=UPI0015AFE681|nr:histone-lysine N-methyltransferase 2D [Anguilla anguilla]
MDNYMKRQMIENDDVFRNTLERIVQKYSRVDGSGMEVCLKSMTCRTEKGILPWDGEVVERQMESLKNIADSTGKSARGQDISADIQDDSQTCSNSTSVSVETEMGRSSENVSWESGPYGSHLMSNAVSDSSLQGELVQPEEQDEELERTLSSQGTLLLDLYPSMLSQVGEAWRRQKVTEAANAVMRRYRRRGWRSSASKPHPQSSTSKPHPQSSASKPHPQSSASNLHPQSSASKPHPQSSASKPHPQSSASKPHPQSSASKPHPQSSTQKPHPQSSAQKLHPQSSAQKPHPQNSASKPHPQSSASKPHPHGSTQKPHTQNSTQKPHPHSAPKPHPYGSAPKPHPQSSAPKLYLQSPTPRSAHEPWRRGLHEGVVGQRADPNLVTDSGSSPEELTLLSHTYAVLSSPTSPVGGTASSPLCLYSTGDSPLPVALPLPPRISPGSTQRTLPLFQRRSPHPSHLKWGCPSRPAPLPQRPPPPDGSPSQPPVPCSVLAQRRRSFAGFQAVRHQIDQQFEELYHRLVCQRKVALPLPSPASPLPSSSSLAALALSPIWMRVRKRDRALEPSAWPEPKRFREGCTCSPGSVRHLRQSWAGCCGSSRPEGAVLPQRRSPGTSRLWGGTFRKDPCSGLSWQLHPNPAASREKGETRASLPEFQGKSPVRASIFLRDWQRGCSPSSSRRRLLYGLPQ